MNVMARLIVPAAFGAALGMTGPTGAPSALAGSLDTCDQERIAAHNTVSNKYAKLLSELDGRIAQAKAAGDDPAKLSYRDRDNHARTVDLIALRADLRDQEAKDAGHADREAAATCGHSSEPQQDGVKIAEAVATRGISTVLPRHMTNIDLAQGALGF